jgi:hypothetical protein
VKLTLHSIFTVINHQFKTGKALIIYRIQVLVFEEGEKEIGTWDINKIQEYMHLFKKNVVSAVMAVF